MVIFRCRGGEGGGDLCVIPMADHEEKKGGELLMDKISEKMRGDGGSSSQSDSDDDRPSEAAKAQGEAAKAAAAPPKVFRLFGREQPVHKVLGGGKRTWSDVRFVSFVAVFSVLLLLSSGFDCPLLRNRNVNLSSERGAVSAFMPPFAC